MLTAKNLWHFCYNLKWHNVNWKKYIYSLSTYIYMQELHLSILWGYLYITLVFLYWSYYTGYLKTFSNFCNENCAMLSFSNWFQISLLFSVYIIILGKLYTLSFCLIMMNLNNTGLGSLLRSKFSLPYFYAFLYARFRIVTHFVR